MIPKIFHRIWFGPAKIPEVYERYWQAWQWQYPDYEFRTWDETDCRVLDLTPHLKTDPVRKSDVARYEILHRFGGIYIDCDMMPYHYLDFTQFQAPLIVCNEIDSDEYFSNSFFACEPGHPALRWAVEELKNKPLGLNPPNEETGPFLFREALKHGRFERLPKEAFFPFLYNEPLSVITERDLSKTYAIHMWAGGWLDEKAILQKAMSRVQWGDLQDCEKLLMNRHSEPAGVIKDLCQTIRIARETTLKALKHPALHKLCEPQKLKAFELLKTSFFLLETDPKAVVWQIGAADGILADPIRPLLINFDPSTVLLEPNPYLFEALKNNYKNNTATQFVNAALGMNAGTMTLNAINPQKVFELNLPDWARGISSFNPVEDPTLAECVESIEVKVIDVTQIEKLPSIVVIDVEGEDFEVLSEIFKADIRPKIIQYEAKLLPEYEQELLLELLGNEYHILSFGADRIAYRKDFLTDYCDYQFLNHGISTLYEEALRVIMNLPAFSNRSL